MNSVNNIFEIALQDLDLSPTMERNARDKYQAISNYLDTRGIESDFFPQGSFQIGTVICKYFLEKVANYLSIVLHLRFP